MMTIDDRNDGESFPVDAPKNVANESRTRFCSNSAANATLFVFAREQRLHDTKMRETKREYGRK